MPAIALDLYVYQLAVAACFPRVVILKMLIIKLGRKIVHSFDIYHFAGFLIYFGYGIRHADDQAPVEKPGEEVESIDNEIIQ